MTPNTQPIEAPFQHPKGMVDLHSIFLTVQGEGPYTGERAVFVRLAGCNLQCPGCDTEYTDGRQRVMPEYIVDRVREICNNAEIENVLIVLTGGEPFRQNITPLLFALMHAGHYVQIETNGVPKISSEMELLLRNMPPELTVVVSPKTSKINAVIAETACAFKYVVRYGDVNHADGLPTRALAHKAAPMVARPPEGWKGTIFVNPMDEHDEKRNMLNTDATLRCCMQHGHRMGVQLHKILNLE